jgi:murein L,D-transpeptidase YafK
MNLNPRSSKKRAFLLFTIIIIFTQLSSGPESILSFNLFKTRKQQVKKAFGNFNGGYIVYVSKKEFRMYVYNRKCKVIAKYKIGYGRNTDKKPKSYEGDSRTPEGVYKITEKLSVHANKKSESYKKIKMLNDTFLKAEEGYTKFGQPTADTGKNAYGPRVFWLDYPTEKDRENYDLALKKGAIPIKDNEATGIGHGITIHGNNDPPSVGQLSTAGCIIMYNRDILRLDKLVQVGTPVIISWN